MTDETLISVLYANDLNKTLELMKVYKDYLLNGIPYEDLLFMMDYDYKVYLEKQSKKKQINTSDDSNIFKLNQIEQDSSNIESEKDALCKYKALKLAQDLIFEDKKALF